MNKKITEERFKEIKKFLNTPIPMYPSITFVAEEFGCSTGTISSINRSKTYEEYRKYHKKYNDTRLLDLLRKA